MTLRSGQARKLPIHLVGSCHSCAMPVTTTSPLVRTVSIAVVGGLAALLHGLVALDSLRLLFAGDDSGMYAKRMIGFGLLAALSLGSVGLAYRWPRLWVFALLAAIVLLVLAFSDLRSVGLTPV